MTIAPMQTLIPYYPCRDLDGTPHPGCDHHDMTTDSVELAVVEGIARAILAAGLPVPFVRAGDRIKTTWGCERNKTLKVRDAIISDVTVGLYRHRQSMWYRPAYEYTGKAAGQRWGMHLIDITREDGEVWNQEHGGSWSPIKFSLEWVSPIHGGIERSLAAFTLNGART